MAQGVYDQTSGSSSVRDRPRTVIDHFLTELTSALAAEGAHGAAARTIEAAARLEPDDRILDRRAEYRRLLLLADRAFRVWSPAAVVTLRDARLAAFASHHHPVSSPSAADAAAALVGSLRASVRLTGAAVRSVTPEEVETALAAIESLLVAMSRTRDDDTAAVVTIAPEAARALIQVWHLTGFDDGIPGEAAETTLVLDTLDESACFSWGTRPRERTMGEDWVHRQLLDSLIEYLARQAGVVLYADGIGALRAPPKVGRHRPDLVGRAISGDLFLGEAKVGPDLFEAYTQEQFVDFATFAPDGHSVRVFLAVPTGWSDEAGRAIQLAVGRPAVTVSIIEMAGTEGATLPPPRGRR